MQSKRQRNYNSGWNKMSKNKKGLKERQHERQMKQQRSEEAKKRRERKS
jgi:hypothetical protein